MRWENIFSNLVQMLRAQQNQIQSILKDRESLQKCITIQNDRWASDTSLYEAQISEMKGILISEEKKRLVEAAKADLMLGSKHREASVLKWILEHTEDELADFRSWFEYLSHKSSSGEQDEGKIFVKTDKSEKGTKDSEKKSMATMVEEGMSPEKLIDELRLLKEEYDKLSSEKDSEVSVLLAEKKSLWNQYNVMEKNYINELTSKQSEVARANEKIEKLISRLEQLQSGNGEKDDKISQLEREVASMEVDKKGLDEEISRLSVELESLRKFMNTQVTPISNPCTAGTKTSDMGGTEIRRGRSNITLKKEIIAPCSPDPATESHKKIRNLKRKESPDIIVSDTPKLLSSNFKVPKLKKTSPSVR